MIGRSLRLAAAVALLVLPRPNAAQGPAQTFGPLFAAVQEKHVFADGKTFADAIPKVPVAEIMRRYASERPDSVAALRAFVTRYFRLPDDPVKPGLRAHIQSLWSPLTRPPIAPGQALGTMLPLPAAYVVPGGRFRELYYWDSYFTMLGLRPMGAAS